MSRRGVHGASARHNRAGAVRQSHPQIEPSYLPGLWTTFPGKALHPAPTPQQGSRPRGAARSEHFGSATAKPAPSRSRPCVQDGRASRPARRASGGQALAPLGATCVDHRPPAAGLHADQEPVGARATDLRGLVSALHDFSGGYALPQPRKSGRERQECRRPEGKARRVVAPPALACACGQLALPTACASHHNGRRARHSLPDSGKPAITAKNPLRVKHLHGKSRRCAGIDADPETVDNHALRSHRSPHEDPRPKKISTVHEP